MDSTKASLLAASVAAVLATMACTSSTESTPANAQSSDNLVKCEGINECKGTSECKGSDGSNDCQGLNSCKGQGWVSVPQEECDQKGGKVLGGAPAPSGDDGKAADASKADDDKDSGVVAKALKCSGINECKGTSDCKGAGHECKGMNDCKGQGWVEVPSEGDCTGKGGEIIS